MMIVSLRLQAVHYLVLEVPVTDHGLEVSLHCGMNECSGFTPERMGQGDSQPRGHRL